MMAGNRVFEHRVPPGNVGVRLSDYLQIAFESVLTRKGGKKAIKQGLIQVNGTTGTTRYRVNPGDVIEYHPDATSRPKAYPIKLEVIFEDDWLAVVRKPAGLLVSGNAFRTLENALIHNINESAQTDALPWPLPVHRLDLQTSGLLLVAKTRKARVDLGHAFEQRKVRKTYHAVVIGRAPDADLLRTTIDGKPSETQYECLDRARSPKYNWLSLLKLFPRTGRRHQLRIHLSGSGFPIVGDKEHGYLGKILRGKGLFLAATGLAFRHPVSEKILEFSLPIPPKFERYMQREHRRHNSVYQQ